MVAENHAVDNSIDITGYQTIFDNYGTYLSQNNLLHVGKTPEGDHAADNTLLDPTMPDPKGAEDIVDMA